MLQYYVCGFAAIACFVGASAAAPKEWRITVFMALASIIIVLVFIAGIMARAPGS